MVIVLELGDADGAKVGVDVEGEALGIMDGYGVGRVVGVVFSTDIDLTCT